jgi:DNA polymerase III alpha subunit
MNKDIYGQHIYTEQELCTMLMRRPDRQLDGILTDFPVTYHPDLEIENPPTVVQYQAPNLTIEEFDSKLQQNWHMPQEYRDFDIVKYLLDRCEGDDAKLQRVGEELLLYVERDLIPLLQYLHYLVATMRLNNIVWGLGRGSSVASYVLYLLDVHRIDSMYYDLDIKEFLR